MSITRNNHFVPQWYQRRFFVGISNTLYYLDLFPPGFTRSDGTTGTVPGLRNRPTSTMFCQEDLYSTFFETQINDEIERKLFGGIDTRGATAIRAFTEVDETGWHANFETLFQYVDIQKLRTPKGLDWLRRHYPELSQNELMLEMQGIQFMNCTIWTSGVREIVSAEKSPVKFIVSDHPVTIYNHALPPGSTSCKYPMDPDIALKASQTIFPLGPDHCLILTNLEYAKDPATNPLENRTFARNYRPTMVSTIDFIRSRELAGQQVTEINFVLKARAKKNIAAGQKEWLYPERTVQKSWGDLRHTLLPPEGALYRFGGEMYASYDSGYVHYQDEFGRTDKSRPYLQKKLPASPLRGRDACGCGSGLQFETCCKPKAEHLRPSWCEVSIRERNLMLFRGLSRLLDLDSSDWADVRRNLTDEKIATAYGMYASLWPLDTDLLALLPKPDGRFRSVFTGSLHPQHLPEFAVGSALYFGEVLVQHPFIHPETLAQKYRPTEHPTLYRGEFLKAMMAFMTLMPLVEAGVVNLFPDPCDFDFHLRDQMMRMARARASASDYDLADDTRMEEMFREEHKRVMLSLSDERLKKQIERAAPEEGAAALDEIAPYFDLMREDDPLVILQKEPSPSEGSGQFHPYKMAPNFELAMYLAQATGSQILTDSKHRWREIGDAMNRRFIGTAPALPGLVSELQASPLAFPAWWGNVQSLHHQQPFVGFRDAMRSAFNYTKNLKSGSERPNFENQLAARVAHHRNLAIAAIDKNEVAHSLGAVRSVMRVGGIQDNTVNRLLLMSGSKHHLPNVPMATFIDRPRPNAQMAMP
ncbi:DUF4238 domain-containing protein [Paradevosia shaoguanensis]|uniref:DUF4238 domain-containing protein n=1 Tax=Paradevosia shaoguanensis TaxID=1335043 RepID=UPI003C7871B5